MAKSILIVKFYRSDGCVSSAYQVNGEFNQMGDTSNIMDLTGKSFKEGIKEASLNEKELLRVFAEYLAMVV